MARILVIDDDDDFRKMLCDALKNEGHDIVGAPNGKEGVDLYLDRKADLIITDINMPEKSGPELIFELQKDFPDVKIIAVSGGTENSKGYLKDIAALSGVKYTLHKPFAMDELFQAVKEAIG